MDNDLFNEYRTILETALQQAGNKELIAMFPIGDTNNIYIGSKCCKNCRIYIEHNQMIVMLKLPMALMQPYPQYRTIDHIDLSDPKSINRLGKILVDVLNGFYV